MSVVTLSPNLYLANLLLVVVDAYFSIVLRFASVEVYNINTLIL